MIFFRTNVVCVLCLSALLWAGCGPSTLGLSGAKKAQAVVVGFENGHRTFALTQNRYWSSAQDNDNLFIENSAVGTGVSPVWLKSVVPNNFELSVKARFAKEGLDGGWGVEFGAQDQKHAYRLLVYASGRFCLDRWFGAAPEFIHCVPKQPQVNTGTATNVLTVKVQGQTISVSVNEQEIVAFKDERYKPGDIALAVGGAGTRVRFLDMYLMELP